MDAPARPAEAPVPPHVYLVLTVAVLAVSSAAVLVRAIDHAHPLAIAFWRTLAVAVVLSPAVRRVSARDAARIALSGACLAAHFATWFASLEYIGVLRSTVLVSLGPLFAGVLEWGALGRRPRGTYWLGLAIAFPGVLLLTGADPAARSLWGDLLAVAGAVLGAAYLVLGRSVRSRVGIGTYASLVCAAAAAFLLPAALAAGVALVDFPPRTWALLGALALGPQLLGHNGFNYALRWLPAATVASVTILEPAGATVLAVIFLDEIPTLPAVLGGLLSVVGVWVATRRSGPTSAPSSRPRPRPP